MGHSARLGVLINIHVIYQFKGAFSMKRTNYDIVPIFIEGQD